MIESAWCPLNLSVMTSDIASRGGSTMININDTIYLFGGANRGQINFSDLWVMKEEDGEVKAKCVECEGDVPMPRSDHSVVGYDNRYLILFGGKNYQNEECYSDLYLLDLMSFEWSYVGEAGEEIDVRCGHSLGLLRTPPPQQQQIEQIEVQSIQGSRPGSVLEAETEAGAGAGAEVQPGVKTEVGEAPTAPPVPVATTYLVVFGGSHPETGTCANDTFFAMLPSSATDIGVPKDFFVTWQKLQNGNLPSSVVPAAREMHSTAHFRDQYMYISGGMSQTQPKGLSDVWRLSATATAAATETASVSGADTARAPAPLKWERCVDIELPTPLFGHCSCITESASSGRVLLCTMSGISGGDCVVEDMLCTDITATTTTTAVTGSSAAAPTKANTNPWVSAQWRNIPSQPVHFRMGLCFLSGGVPAWLFARHRETLVPSPAQQQQSQQPKLSASAKRSARKKKTRAAAKANKQKVENEEAEIEADDTAAATTEPAGRPDETSVDADADADADGDADAVVEVSPTETETEKQTAAVIGLDIDTDTDNSNSNNSNSNSNSPNICGMDNCVLLFGGVDQLTDYHDLWLFHCLTHGVGVEGPHHHQQQQQQQTPGSSTGAGGSAGGHHKGLVSVLC